MIRAATSFILFIMIAQAGTETVNVSDHGTVDLGAYECRDINRSTIVQRVCYDKAESIMIVGLQGRYDQYCALSAATFDGFMAAPSMGQFLNQNVGDAGPGGRYDCPSPRRPGY